MKKKPFYFVLSFILLAGIIGFIIYGGVVHKEICPICAGRSFGPAVIRHYIEGFGPWAIIVYVLLYIINTITLLPPIAFMSLSAGALFGPLLGALALASGAFLGTTATFLISKFFGTHVVDKILKGKAANFNEKLGQNGFAVLLPMRLVGFPPYEFINYASGLSKISYKDYISATMTGMAPAIIIQVLLADRLVNFSWSDPMLYVAICLFIGMIVISGKIIEAKRKSSRASVT